MVWGIDVGCGDLAANVVQKSFENGLIIETAGSSGHVVKFLAPLVIEDAQLDQGLSILAQAFKESVASKGISAKSSAPLMPTMDQLDDNSQPPVCN